MSYEQIINEVLQWCSVGFLFWVVNSLLDAIRQLQRIKLKEFKDVKDVDGSQL